MWTCQIEHLGLEHDDAVAEARADRGDAGDDAGRGVPRSARRTALPLESFDCVLMRKDPPVDVNYLQATWMLEHARGKTLLVNDPRGLRELNEHLAVLAFPELTPPTIVTRDPRRAARRSSHEQGGAIVVKPVDGYGGLGIFVVRDGDPNCRRSSRPRPGSGTRWTIGAALPARGACRATSASCSLDGEPVGAVLRVPPPDEARGNLHVGGHAATRPSSTADDHAIIRAIAPLLRSYGQMLRRARRDRRPADRDQHHVADRRPPPRQAHRRQSRRAGDRAGSRRARGRPRRARSARRL